ncbi:MAG: DMT family transporter [Deltaproteobacteria bacterium]|nr:DMT family transporter [Deltaproteobacteria bacterium]
MNKFQANALLMVAAIIWGTTFVVQQVGTGGLEAIMFTGVRTLVGACFILPMALRQFQKVRRGDHIFTVSDWLGICATGLILFTAAALQQYGIFHTTVTNAGFLTALYVPLVPIISLVILRRKVHWSVWPASVCCLVGTYIMSGAQGLDLRVGDLWVIASSLFWALHVILVGRMAMRTQAPLVVACGQFFACGISGTLLGLLIETPTVADFSGALFGILYAGLLSTGVGFTLQVVGQRYTHEAYAAIILSSETVFAGIAGFIFLGERLSMFEMMGAALIFAGIIAVQLLPMLRAKARTLEPEM